MNNIIGRADEIYRLERCMEENEAQLVIVYGRRRVGKTFLINEFFQGRFDFKFTGSFDQPMELQLRNFTTEINRQTGKKLDIAKDWTEAFDYLRDYLDLLDDHEKTVVFFDEMPWMDTPKSGFLSAFEWFWNAWGCAKKNLVFIICGSSSSWMVDKIDHNKGGLFNRVSCRIYLDAFRLKEMEMYLESREIHWSRYDIIQCYMILGGIPYYLKQLDNKLSFNENIDNLFFRKRAELWDEFDHLYHTLFANSEQHIKIVETLSAKRGGLTRKEIVEKTKLPNNGVLTKMLDNLEKSGFIRIYDSFGKTKRDKYYQLSDYYTTFYFRFIKGNYGKDEHYWSNTIDNPARRAWAGFTFEQVCMSHVEQIKKALGISGVLTEISTWKRNGDSDHRGAQIDLIIDRRDMVVNLCEIKFSTNEYVIDKDYDMVLRNKLEAFRNGTGTNKTLQLTMITTYGVARNQYSSFVGKQVVMEDLFA